MTVSLMPDSAHCRDYSGGLGLHLRPRDPEPHHLAARECLVGFGQPETPGPAPARRGSLDHRETLVVPRSRRLYLCNGRRGVPSLCTDEIGRQWTDEMAIERAQVGE